MTLERERQIGRVLLILRITLALYLMQWGIGMLIDPEGWSQMFLSNFDVSIGPGMVWLPGVVELVIVAMFLAGCMRKVSYGAAFILGFLSAAASADVLMRTYTGDHMSQLASLPVVAALWLLLSLREFDIYSLEHWRTLEDADDID